MPLAAPVTRAVRPENWDKAFLLLANSLNTTNQ